ncbi:bifunctional 6-phosphofructo-2-kinase/fructose-2,6-bisphosphate 2-phosphatase [Calocera cornea HHB12733]|uniref:Bifunctional 6-phosphofructo-2-kinase/fructose-2,6-bisphosphate 2-phosphatase n=1 Tax=Calocera cornea HHB12733 TaxID=1353952 RepID=A0A165CKH4_9BASI|nr:bifunctional 6-phosphofructo-2-kinase/fructose-2,6-bisphosphate 2-phosphatase [Calocera cornea HHB12733]
MAAPIYQTASGRLWHAGKILIVAVGLPARGKTHVSRALERYLRWLGVKTQVFSLGDYRRKHIGGAQDLPKDYFQTNEWSEETKTLRASIKRGCEDMIRAFFGGKQRGQVAIYDANNGTKEARRELAEEWGREGVHVIFLESVCTNQDIVEANIRSVKISSPDYKGWDPEKAVADYWTRIREHEQYYHTIDEEEWAWIKVINIGERIQMNRIQGYLQSRIVFFLMNIHTKHRTIYFARSGESLIEHSYKADADLSPSGWAYAERLMDFVLERRRKSVEARRQQDQSAEKNKLVVWTSTRRRSHHSAWPFQQAGYKVLQKSQMCEINPGIWDGLSPEEAMETYPDEYDRFAKDPYAFRAPRAESYHDLSVRLEPVLVELEQCQDDLLIVTHSSVIRCLLGYLIGLPPHEVPAIEINRGDLVEVVPASYGVHSQTLHFWARTQSEGSPEGQNALEDFKGEKNGHLHESPDPGAMDLPPSEDGDEERVGRTLFRDGVHVFAPDIQVTTSTPTKVDPQRAS